MQDRHPTIKVIKTLNISNFTVKIHQKSLQSWKNVNQFNDKIVNVGRTNLHLCTLVQMQDKFWDNRTLLKKQTKKNTKKNEEKCLDTNQNH